MITIDNMTDLEVDLNSLESISDDFTDKEIELIILDSDMMQDINKEQRGKDATTDVLSFPLHDVPHFPLGTIVINADLVKSKADEYKHTCKNEMTLLFIHGLLHLLGFDHETDDGQMREREESIIEELNLPKSLIVRTEDI